MKQEMPIGLRDEFSMKIALAQINTTVGDLQGNYTKILKVLDESDADLIIFPELTITGYPPKDLLMKHSFIQKNLEYVSKIAEHCKEKACLFGFVEKEGENLYNSAALVQNGKVLGIHRKIHLPNYDVFDEKRYFTPGDRASVFELNGKKIGITICEDIWVEDGPIKEQVRQGAEFIVNISASPFYAGKGKVREKIISDQARKH